MTGHRDIVSCDLDGKLEFLPGGEQARLTLVLPSDYIETILQHDDTFLKVSSQELAQLVIDATNRN